MWPLVARVLAASAIGLAVVGLMGWVFNNALLRGLGNDGATMKATTALMLLLAVLAVLHLSAP